MSITIPRTALAGKDTQNELRPGGSPADRSDEDFEVFLILPATVQQQECFQDFSHQEKPEGPLSSAPNVSTERPVDEGSPDTPIRPESLLPAKKLNGIPPQADAEIMTGVGLPQVFETAINGVGQTADSIACQMPEKTTGPAISTFKPGAGGPQIPEPVKTTDPVILFPEYKKTASDGLFLPGAAFASSSAEPISNDGFSIRPAKLPNMYLTLDGKPVRPIEVELKGADGPHINTVDPSSGLYPAGGVDLTPPRLRVSFADIADVLRSGNPQADTILSAGVSDISAPEVSNESSGDGTAAFTNTGTGSTLQTAASSQIGKAETTGFARSIQQIETEILQLASAANLRNEGRSLKIRLDSIELGSVEITLVRHESGSMSAHLITDSESSRQALNENLVQLRNSLENVGLHLRELDISCRSFSSAGQGDRQGREGHPASAAQFHTAAMQETGGNSEVNGESDIRLLNLRA